MARICQMGGWVNRSVFVSVCIRVTSVEGDSNKWIGKVVHFVDFSQTLSQDLSIITCGLISKMAMEERTEEMQRHSKLDVS